MRGTLKSHAVSDRKLACKEAILPVFKHQLRSRESGTAAAAAMAISAACIFLASSLILISASAADSNNNPADELVNAIINNRTAHKSSRLVDSPGLACIALQYIKAYQGKCDEVSNKKPADRDFVETFAPNCGVQASTLAPITGRLLGCQSKYVRASQAFSDLLIQDNKSLEILYSKNHTQVGAAVSGTDGGSPYFWCVLFSSGKPNSTFILDGGEAKSQRPGCFSGTNETCSGASGPQHHLLWPSTAGILIVMAYAFGL
ncbi:uncharacterized protein LOC131250713 [Magnolia sinica]|uniref:uncharacterized protein LOC131250713 n=1 Tax=Magnolia sinica TaxID=86752 RepID=UPI002659E9DF|nr:uncharacterized protein LOC131250713 [Magnolia sinica]